MLQRLALLALILGTLWLINLVLYKPFSINNFFERVFFEQGLDDPELMSRLGLLDKYGIDYHNSQLTDISEAHQNESYHDLVERNIEMLRQYKPSQMTEKQRLSMQILDWYLEKQVLKHGMNMQEYVVNHIYGVQTQLPRFMLEVHKIKDLEDAENYLKRLEKFDDKFYQLKAGLDAREAAGYMLPAHILDRVIHDIQLFVQSEPRKNLLYRDFANKIENAPYILPNAIPELLDEAGSIIEDEVYPAYRDLSQFLTYQRERAPSYAGVHHLPDGVVFYFTQFNYHATADIYLEDEVYEAKEHVAKTQQQLKKEFAKLYERPDTARLASILKKFRQKKSAQYALSPKGLNDCVADLQILAESLLPNTSNFFEAYPELKQVRIVPKDHQPQYAPILSGQLLPSPETPEYCEITLNTDRLSEIHKDALPEMLLSVLFGEVAIEYYLHKQPDLPSFRKILRFRAFEEGFRLYVLHQAMDLGLLSRPEHRIALLERELFYAAEVVVDIGLHYLKWPRQKAIDYLMDETGLLQEEATDLVDRISVLPGESCVYLVGLQKFNEYEVLSQDSTGKPLPHFKLNEILLQDGPMPLSILERKLREKFGVPASMF